MSKQDNVAVQFLKSWRGYNKGEVAGFSAEQAEALIDGKVAEPHAKGKKSASVGADKKAGAGKSEKGAPPADEKPSGDGSADFAGGGEEDDNARP